MPRLRRRWNEMIILVKKFLSEISPAAFAKGGPGILSFVVTLQVMAVRGDCL